MTRREVWACTTLLGIMGMVLVSSLLLSALRSGQVPEPGLLEELRRYGLLAGGAGILGTVGWAWEASKPRSRGGLQREKGPITRR